MNNFIQGAIQHPGALHKSMGIKEGNKIPRAKLVALQSKLHKKAKSGKLSANESTLLKRVNLALTLKKINS